MRHKFGKRSQQKLQTCHPDLIKIMNLAISVSSVDFSITEGHRTVKRQSQLFDEGKSRIDGIVRKSKHNHKPSMAADIAIYHPAKYWRQKIVYHQTHLAYVGGVIQACAEILHANGDIDHLIRWGANWNNDGVLLMDQSFQDMPHFELVRPD